MLEKDLVGQCVSQRNLQSSWAPRSIALPFIHYGAGNLINIFRHKTISLSIILLRAPRRGLCSLSGMPFIIRAHLSHRVCIQMRCGGELRSAGPNNSPNRKVNTDSGEIYLNPIGKFTQEKEYDKSLSKARKLLKRVTMGNWSRSISY